MFMAVTHHQSLSLLVAFRRALLPVHEPNKRSGEPAAVLSASFQFMRVFSANFHLLYEHFFAECIIFINSFSPPARCRSVL